MYRYLRLKNELGQFIVDELNQFVVFYCWFGLSVRFADCQRCWFKQYAKLNSDGIFKNIRTLSVVVNTQYDEGYDARIMELMIRLLGGWYGFREDVLWKESINKFVIDTLKLVGYQYPGDSERWENNKVRVNSDFKKYYLEGRGNFGFSERGDLCRGVFSGYCD